MTKNLILGSYGFGNIGDRAILYSVLDNYPGETAVTCFKKTWIKRDVEKIHYWSPRILKKVVESENLVVGGEPVLDSYINNNVNLLSYYILTLLLLGRFTGSKIIFDSIGLYRTNKITRFLIRRINPDKVLVRDKLSAFNVEQLGLKNELVRDPVLRNVRTYRQENLEKISINIRFTGKDIDRTIEDVFTNVVKRLENRYEVNPFTTHPLHRNIGITNSPQTLSDVNALSKIGFDVERETRTVEDLEMELDETDLLIAMRMHSIIFGLNQGIKTIGISYHPKVSELCEEHDIPFLELEELEERKLLDLIESVSQDRST